MESTSTTPIGDEARVNYLYGQLNSATFTDPPTKNAGAGGQLNGTVSNLISQTMDFQGSSASAAQNTNDSHTTAMAAITSRMTDDYGVNVNDEMAQLVQLQASYAANARVVSTAQDLLTSLLQAVQL